MQLLKYREELGMFALNREENFDVMAITLKILSRKFKAKFVQPQKFQPPAIRYATHRMKYI